MLYSIVYQFQVLTFFFNVLSVFLCYKSEAISPGPSMDIKVLYSIFSTQPQIAQCGHKSLPAKCPNGLMVPLLTSNLCPWEQFLVKPVAQQSMIVINFNLRFTFRHFNQEIICQLVVWSNPFLGSLYAIHIHHQFYLSVLKASSHPCTNVLLNIVQKCESGFYSL